jgi:hypothetical protein
MNQRAEIIDTLSKFFDFQKNRTGKSILLFLAGFIALGLVSNALYTAIGLLAKWVLYRLSGWQLVEKPVEMRVSALVEILFVAILFGVVFLIMKRHARRAGAPSQRLALETPEPHPGLIFLLSKYSHRDRSRFGDYDRIDLKAADARWQLLQSNWGPLVIAVEHHASKNGGGLLRHCWLLCTRGGSEPQFEAAKQIVEKFGGAKVRCHKEEIKNFNDIIEVTNCVEKIYREAASGQNLLPDQIIADFTGGNSVMSGGVVLASSQKEDRKIQYVRQDKPLVKKAYNALSKQEVEVPLSVEEMQKEQVLITIVAKPIRNEEGEQSTERQE